MLKRATLEGFKNITRSFWLSATAISVLTVSLASVVLVATISTTVGFTVRNLDNLVSIPVILKEGVPEDKVPDILDRVNRIPDVKKTEYYDKVRTKADLQSGGVGFNSEFLKSISNTDENLLSRSILVTPNSSEKFAGIVKVLKGDDFKDNWDEVVGDESFVTNLISIYKWTQWVGFGLILVFALVSILVMSNILRITIYSHREEIEIMRLVGATNNYIRAPFIAEGIYYNLAAAVIVTSIFIPGFGSLLPVVQGYIGADLGNNSNLIAQVYSIFGITLGAGILVGILTSYFAIKRYLKL